MANLQYNPNSPMEKYALNINQPKNTGNAIPDFTLKAVQAFKGDGGGSGLDSFKGTAAGASTGNPYLAAAGLAVDVAGLGLQGYGAYKAEERAEEEAEKAEKRYQEELRRYRDLEANRLNQQRLSNEITHGTYAQNLQDRALKSYFR